MTTLPKTESGRTHWRGGHTGGDDIFNTDSDDDSDSDMIDDED